MNQDEYTALKAVLPIGIIVPKILRRTTAMSFEAHFGQVPVLFNAGLLVSRSHDARSAYSSVSIHSGSPFLPPCKGRTYAPVEPKCRSGRKVNGGPKPGAKRRV